MAQNANFLIQTDHLSKQYSGQPTPALQDLSIRVAAGEAYGFLGPNGAGKSTTIRTLLNFIQPTGGSATIYGMDIVRDSVKLKRHVGYLPGDVALYGKMTGEQFLQYMAELQPIRHKKYLDKLTRTLDTTLNRPLAALSKGNRQKIGLVQAFMHEPEVLILDEPTNSLDPLMQEVFYEMVAEAKVRGAAVFLSSHNLAEVKRMCDRIGFIRAGKLLAERTVGEFSDNVTRIFDIKFVGQAPLATLRKIPGAKVALLDKQTATVRLSGELSPLFAILAQYTVVDLHRREVSLDKQFLRYYEGGGS